MSTTLISTYDEYRAILSKMPQKGRAFINNNLLMKSRLVDLIESDLLFFEEGNDYVCFYIKNKCCYHLLLHAVSASNVIISRKDLPIRFDYTYMTNPLLEETVLTIMNNNQFQLISKNVEMRLNRAKVIHSAKPPNQGAKIRNILAHEIDSLIEIWIETLAEEINPIPDKKKLEKELDDTFVLLVGEEPAGGARITLRGNRVYIEQVAVSPSHQGMGYGLALLTYFERRFVEKDIYLWVSSSNKYALAIYEKFGFERSGKLSAQYVLEEKRYEKQNY